MVITYCRAAYLRDCLAHLAGQSRPPEEVVVVDQSPDDSSREVVADFPFARWVDNRVNAGRMTTSRNVGLRHVSADVVSFIDDDSLPEPAWALTLLDILDENGDLGGVGGRVDNGNYEELTAPGPIGVVTGRGKVVGNFGSLQSVLVSVDHVVGANMSFRRELLVQLGGFREDYPGTAMGEDTDIGLRVRALGHDLGYASDAVVKHVSAPHVTGTRFDGRYSFYAAANYLLLVRRAFGARSGQFRGRLCAFTEEFRSPRSLKGRIFRSMCTAAGTIYGLWLCLRLDGLRRPDLVLDDQRAQALKLCS
ncbi:glycosyltransferase family 2 protein [Nocardioides litoris]|uniref:glycosyltransferase family 2 protein n=1 Tax=Nocardioides litoris TaxID=1926648 RepID=UPI001477465C|nr:glycosyltransferase family 2 protein [Nocardioides litoris]